MPSPCSLVNTDGSVSTHSLAILVSFFFEAVQADEGAEGAATNTRGTTRTNTRGTTRTRRRS